MLNFFAWVVTIVLGAALIIMLAAMGWMQLALILDEPWGAVAGAIAGILLTLAAVAWYQIRRAHRRSYRDAVKALRPIAYWPLDDQAPDGTGTAKDAMGKHSGTHESQRRKR